MGAKNEKGIWLYGEDDAATATTFSELLNLGQQSVSDRISYFAGTTAERLALDPAPAGALWRDTNNGERLYSPDPTGKWRQHEGAISANVAAFTSSSPVFYASVALTIPTVLAASEAIELYVIGANTAAYLTVSADTVTRGAASTDVTARLSRIAAGGGLTVTFGWRVVRGI